MLRSGEQVMPRLFGGSQVEVARAVNVGKATIAAPVLGSGVGVDDLGYRVQTAQPAQQTVVLLGERVGQLVVGEGKLVAELGADWQDGWAKR